MNIGKRGILIITLIVLLSSLVSAGLFTGVWQDYFTGRQIGVQSSGRLIYSIGPSVPQYTVPFNIVVVTNRPARCQYTLGGATIYADFSNNGGTDHIESVSLTDGNILFKARCKELGWFKPWEYTQTNFIVSTKGGCCIVGNNCNTYKTPGECTNLGGALYPDPSCKYTNCQVAIADVKKPDLIIENVEVEIRQQRVGPGFSQGPGFPEFGPEGGVLELRTYKIRVKNIGNAPVEKNFFICMKSSEGIDYCDIIMGTVLVEQVHEEETFFNRIFGIKKTVVPLNPGDIKEVLYDTTIYPFPSVFVVDEYKKILSGEIITYDRICAIVSGRICLEWKKGENKHNLVDELDEGNNEYVLP